MENIKIEMPKEITVLAGHELGLFVYHKYIKEKFDIKKTNKLEFPDHVEMLCPSFIRGMLQPLLSQYTTKEVYDSIITEDKFKEEIKEELDL